MHADEAGPELEAGTDPTPAAHRTRSRPRPLTVLLVAPPSTPTPAALDGPSALRVLSASSLRTAAERARADRPDAVAVDHRLATDARELARLDAALDGAPLLLLEPAGGEDGPRWVDGTLPAEAPSSTTPHLIRAAAELRHLRRELADTIRERDEHRGRFEALVQGNADGIMVVDELGIVRFANPAAGRLFGRPLAALVGSTFGHPLVAGETTEVDLLAPGMPPTVVEMRVVHIDWEGFPAYIACLRDVTDRKHAEESARRLIRSDAERSAAEEASGRFRFLAEAGAALAASLDERTTMSTLARLCVEELADWAAVYLAGEDGRPERLEVVHRDPARAPLALRLRDRPLDAASSAPVFEVLSSGKPMLEPRVTERQLSALRGDAETRALVEGLGMGSCLLLPLTARSRQLGVLELVRSEREPPYGEADLTFASSLAARAALAVDNARLYQTARAADQAKSDLIAVISHDLRTPLNSIIGYTDLLDLGVPDPVSEGALDWVRRIRRSAEHQVHLIDQLLTFSRVEAGVELRATAVDAQHLLEDVYAMMEPLAAKAGLALTVHADPGLVLRTDPDPLCQVLVNLVGNAVKYTERGSVRLRATREGDAVVFTVSDTGVGIEPHHQQRIFDPFWQVHRDRRSGGTGLGLSIVSRLVRLLGGEITVESEPGRGSTFTVRLTDR